MKGSEQPIGASIKNQRGKEAYRGKSHTIGIEKVLSSKKSHKEANSVGKNAGKVAGGKN